MARSVVRIQAIDVHKNVVNFDYEPIPDSRVEPVKQFIHDMQRGVWHEDIEGNFYSPVHIVCVLGSVE